MNICNFSQWENNEVKCAIIKIQNVIAADNYEQTSHCKWPNIS